MKKLLSSVALAGAVMLSTHAFAADLIVGVSWSNFQEERWKTDEAAIVAALKAAGADYISADAQSSPSKQLSDIESLISRGADALIVLAQDSASIGAAVNQAINEGIPVVGYDRLIENPNAYYITFNNKEVGRLQAEAVFAKQPTGNYVFIKGAPTDPNADILHQGQLEVLQSAIDSGDIKVVGEAYTESWQPAIAQRNMEQFLTAADNKVDAVVASNDGTAGGAIAALAAQGMQGIPVSGQDGDHAALNRVALGTQTVSVWKDARELGKKAAEIAVELAKGTKLDDVDGTQDWTSPNGTVMKSYFLKPVAITQDNLNVVIDAGWVSKDVVCKGVESGKVAACN
ncbi:sugar ABC transporter substrate-binding protein [Thalassospira profundimaris]|uniref:D-xylose-binding periplasmic protein n=1 Tax=Thalassospira profundimaris TaxID=502049 RepID=A0A367XBK7_9PROT|nr:D-xylose ABC transporter substrate-binding protein [Thalassospira profundimaris]RCK50829.1 sugar ABC transporter substrate-binding protein [Thalassospira profundimaris]